MDEEENQNETLISPFSNPEEMNEVLIKYVREKEELKKELDIKEKEILSQKARIYDLVEKTSSLRTENEELKKSSRQLPIDNASAQTPASKLVVVRPTTAKSRSPMPQRAKSARQRAPPKSRTSKIAQETPVRVTQPVNDSVSEADQAKIKKLEISLAHFEEVGKRFPELKLSVLLTAEKFFNQCDINNDGLIDDEELEKLLMKQGHLFTNNELMSIMKEIDQDQGGTIDIMEYLAVLERIQERKRVNLPHGLVKSSVCSIQ